MRRALTAALVPIALLLTGCGGGDSTPRATAADDAPSPTVQAAQFSADVRTNFLDSCLENAKQTANGSATDEVLEQTCVCILGRVEQEYTEAEFAAFEQRLVGGTASAEESAQLTAWSADCAEQAAG